MELNQNVTGNYMGCNFCGVITAMRPLTVKTDGCFEYRIDLDSPIVVFGEKREAVIVYAQFDGTPSSYNKHATSIQ